MATNDDDRPIWTDAECNRYIWEFSVNSLWIGLWLGFAVGVAVGGLIGSK